MQAAGGRAQRAEGERSRTWLVVPRAPGWLELRIQREWNGAACSDARLHARVTLQARAAGLHVAAASRDPEPERVPATAPGSRVADLWHYDVVELFLVGRSGCYLELELGAGGHFLVLSFRAPRERCDDHADLRPAIAHARGPSGWRAELLLDWDLVPPGVSALNAFACARGRLLAHHPVPGAAPDFHQPAAFPRARIER